jgi:hypothetical protein
MTQVFLALCWDSMLFLRLSLTLATGVSKRNASSYIRADNNIGFTFERAGFATVEIEPNNAAAKKAHKYPNAPCTQFLTQHAG